MLLIILLTRTFEINIKKEITINVGVSVSNGIRPKSNSESGILELE